MKDVQTLEEWAGTKRPTLYLVFTDIIDSTILADLYGDDAWAEILIAHFKKARDLRAQFESYEIKLIGDAYMVVFKAPEAALEFSAEFVLYPGHDAIEIRAAIHGGPVTIIENDIYGLMVNKASRLASSLDKLPSVVLSEQAHSAALLSYGEVGRQLFRSYIADLPNFGEERAWQYISCGFFEAVQRRHEQVLAGRASRIRTLPRSSKL